MKVAPPLPLERRKCCCLHLLTSHLGPPLITPTPKRKFEGEKQWVREGEKETVLWRTSVAYSSIQVNEIAKGNMNNGQKCQGKQIKYKKSTE
uniref:Uncharacterized protein n=1 Tax=Manihot esculenta TaxID=3983 RepID=A0A2C9WE30_MANES